MKKRFLVLLVLACVLALLLPLTVSATQVQNGFSEDGNYFYRDGEMVAGEVIEHEGKYYGFDDSGWLYRNQEFCLDTWYRAKEDGTLYVNEWFYQEWGPAYYYGEGGRAATDFLQIDGVWYFFDGSGNMRYDEVVWSEDYQAWYRLSEDGASHTKVNLGWYQDENGEWYYFSEGGRNLYDFVKINNKWYYFSDNRMLHSQVVWSNVDNAWYALSSDGERYQALRDLGWNSAFGKWYYSRMNGEQMEFVTDEVVEDGGKLYYLDYEGVMAESRVVEVFDYENYNWKYYIADAKGVLSTDGWYRKDGYWRYLQDGQHVDGGVHEINGKLYLFDGYNLNMVPGEQYIWDFYGGDYYYITPNDGQLLRNQWYERTVTYPYELGWVYYGKNGRAVRNEVLWIDKAWYGFDSRGVMRVNEIVTYDNGTYLFNADGTATKVPDGWVQEPVTKAWMYVKNDQLYDGILELGDTAYAFSNGYMLTNTAWEGAYKGVWGLYLFDENGEIVTYKASVGNWVYQDQWYYMDSDSTLALGWLSSGGKWYMMNPGMAVNALYYAADEKVTYAIGSDGVCTALKKNGLQRVDSSLVYIKNGRAVTNSWVKVDGYYYYFDGYGYAAEDGVHGIGGYRFLFDQSGRMCSGGWVKYSTRWYYADPANDSALLIGLQTIGGTKYVFSDYGHMCEEGVFESEGKYYGIAPSGAVEKIFTEGWNEYDGEWYYISGGVLVSSQTMQIGGATYAFDYDGEMYHSGVHYTGSGYYVFAPDGKIQSGWYKLGGRWAYGDPQNGNSAAMGAYRIGGKQYIFDDDGYLQIGTFTLGDYVYTTNADGVVVSEKEVPKGWYLTNNCWYYKGESTDYTGWLGEYYVEDGRMVYEQAVEYDGKVYFLKANGQVLRNGWYESAGYYETYAGNWVLARADGSLYCSQWVQQGRDWYYFYGPYMVQDRVEVIDGVEHEFDENGKWLGEYQYNRDIPTGRSNGWHQIKGKWYYFNNGQAMVGEIYVGGKFFYMDPATGAMLTNTIKSQYEGSYYYGSDGARVIHTGWKQIGGKWYLFNPDSTLYFGLTRDSSGWCYLMQVYNEKTDTYACEMLKNGHAAVGRELYRFNSSGYAKSAVNHNGWYQTENGWYYLENGALLGSGLRTINGVRYYFYSGLMVEDEWIYTHDGRRYFGKSGAMVTKQGWYQTDGKWIYVGADGELYDEGIYFIDGKEYTFRECYMISG